MHRKLALVPFLVLSLATSATEAQQTMRLYIGAYTRGIPEEAPKGIHLVDLDLADGSLTHQGLAVEADNPSFLEIHPNRTHLYAVSEIEDFQGKSTGAVAAYSIDAKTGELTFLNKQATGGTGPCHVCLDASGHFVLVANYGGGSVSAAPIDEDGRLGERSGFAQHQGSSVNPRRQEAPHAHSVNVDPTNRFAFVADLGLDRILIYRLDAQTGALRPHDPPFATVDPGAGPRHLAFHPSGRFVYVINELASTITVFEYDLRRGSMAAVQTISTLPEGFTGENTTAEVRAHPSGRFVYGSNRGHDSIAIFAVDLDSGRLTAVGHQGEGIATPRNFELDPTGRFAIVANQRGGDVLSFRVDPGTGELSATGGRVEIPRPVCVRMIPKPE